VYHIINDRIGPTQENTISADLSYTIPTSENSGNFLLASKQQLIYLI
jgi:hypothetical protein